MKINRGYKSGYIPIVITLETKYEALAFLKALGTVYPQEVEGATAGFLKNVDSFYTKLKAELESQGVELYA